MAEQFSNLVVIVDQSGVPIISLNAASREIRLAGTDGAEFISVGGPNQFLTIRDPRGEKLIQFDRRLYSLEFNNLNIFGAVLFRRPDDKREVSITARTGIQILNQDGDTALRLHPEGYMTIGGPKTTGRIFLADRHGTTKIQMGEDEQNNGEFEITIKANQTDRSGIIQLNSQGNIYAGGGNRDGDLVLRDKDGKEIIHAGAAEQYVVIKNREGKEGIRLHLDNGYGIMNIGSVEKIPGLLNLFDYNGKSRIRLSGETGTIEAGSIELKGSIYHEKDGNQRKFFDSVNNNIWLGGNGPGGDIMIFSKDATDTHDHNKATIHLNGDAGDIILRNADCAEDFEIAGQEEIAPGNVVVINKDGNLILSTEPYDKRVAGVISGAGDYKPGIVLDRQASQQKRLPVSLVGKVYCKVDAHFSPINVGDLLTTSSTPGHAMKADDPIKAFGAVIGKALRPLDCGKGLIPILVALQ